MAFELILKKTPYDPNSYFKEIPDDIDGISEKYDLTDYECMTIGILFFKKINDVCDCCVGTYDVDYLNKEQCEKLYTWLKNNIEEIKEDPKISRAMQVLMEYAKRATELGTGMVFEI